MLGKRAAMTALLIRAPAVLAPPPARDFWHKLLAYGWPRYLVALGYVDEGNWARDIAARRVAVWMSPASTVIGVPANC